MTTKEWKYLDWTDDKLLERACDSKGCKNFKQEGYIYCTTCLHGSGKRMPEELWRRKLELEKTEQARQR